MTKEGKGDGAGNGPWLFTPGPLTTARATREAMLRDYGSRDGDFVALNARLRERLVTLAGGKGSHACVLLAGSGTYAVEAALGSLVPRQGKTLILVNGAYGARMARICDVLGRAKTVLEWGEHEPVDAPAVGKALRDDPAITHVALVHCETTSGILNPLADIADVVSQHDRGLLVDAMSSFGALEVDVQKLPCEAVMASSNKCLEGVPGAAFVIAGEKALRAAQGNAPSLVLDLYDQWQAMEKNGQWRFTPPTHVLAAFDKALDGHAQEGGAAGRRARYQRNWRILVEGMRAIGFETLLPDSLQAPIIVTFLKPRDPKFIFEDFYDRLRKKNYAIYPGKLTKAETFRIGCIGQLHEAEMRGLIGAVGEVLADMGVAHPAP